MMNSNNISQKIKMIKNIENIIKENNENNKNDNNINIIKNKLNKSETQFYPSNIISYKDLGKDCNYFRKRNIGNIGTLRTEPNKFENNKNLKHISTFQSLTNITNIINESNDYNEFSEEKNRICNKNKRRYNSFGNFKKENINNFHKNNSSNMIIPSKFNKHQNLKKEIDDLDEEIIEIQTKINEILHK